MGLATREPISHHGIPELRHCVTLGAHNTSPYPGPGGEWTPARDPTGVLDVVTGMGTERYEWNGPVFEISALSPSY